MTLYGRIPRIEKPFPRRLPQRDRDGARRKSPRPFTDGVIVTILHPYGVLSRMSAIAPPPQLAPYLKVHARKRTFSNTVSMIVRPSPYNGIEPIDQILLCRRFILLDDSPDFCQSSLNVLLRRRDQQLPSILAYVLAEKVEPVLDVSHASFFR